MEKRTAFELAVNAGLQAIPCVGGPLATLYFSYKDEQRFQRIEKTLGEICDELKSCTIPDINVHNPNELMPLIDEVTDNIENEHVEQKRILYKKYFKSLLLTPTNGNYEERKLFLDVLTKITSLQIELFIFLLDKKDIIDLEIIKNGVDNSIVQSTIKQLINYGLVNSNIHSISLGTNFSTMPMKLNITEFGRKFNEFCLK